MRLQNPTRADECLKRGVNRRPFPLGLVAADALVLGRFLMGLVNKLFTNNSGPRTPTEQRKWQLRIDNRGAVTELDAYIKQPLAEMNEIKQTLPTMHAVARRASRNDVSKVVS